MICQKEQERIQQQLPLEDSAAARLQKLKQMLHVGMEKKVEGQEDWRAIVFTKGNYEVSNLGRIRSVLRPAWGRPNVIKGGIILKPRIVATGYVQQAFFVDGVRIVKYTARLVAEAFLPNPFNKEEVNHISGDKLDNRVQNLEWVTHGENVAHSAKNGLASSKINPEIVRQIRNLRAQGLIYKAIANKLGISRFIIPPICQGLNWKHVV